jgi:hypothetical protein
MFEMFKRRLIIRKFQHRLQFLMFNRCSFTKKNTFNVYQDDRHSQSFLIVKYLIENAL